MELINKAAVVEEIERIRTLVGDGKFLSEYESGCRDKTLDICDDLLSFLDTLEVKEVDIEKIIEQTYYDGSVIDTADIDHVTYENVALHFYELGLKANIGK